MSKTTITVSGSSQPGSATDTSTMPQYSAISEHSSVKGTPNSIAGWLVLSALASPASPSAPLESGSAQTTPETCGRPRSIPFARFDPASHSWRTSQDSLLNLMDISEPSSPTWPRQGMTHAGRCYRLAIVAPRTCGNGFGLLPPPVAYDATPGGPNNPQTWPTPRSGSDAMCGGSGHQAMLKGTSLEKGRGQLNPTWVEWLMGWPLGWTDLKPLETDRFRSWLQQHGGF